MSPEPRPRIVFVFGAYALGGAEKQLASLVEHRPARARGVEVRTLTLHPTRSTLIEERFEAEGIAHDLVSWDAQSFPSFFLNLVRCIRRLRPGIVHTLLDGSSGTWGRLAAYLNRVPVILHSDLSLVRAANRSDRPLRPFLDRITTHFLPNAHAIADRVARGGVPRERITVIPCGVDLTIFAPERVTGLRAELGIPDDAVVAGFLGRFERVKRIDVLLDALQRLPEAARPDHVLLAGDGSLMPEMAARVAGDAWLSEHVHLLGSVRRVPEFLASLDYLVHPSEIEGLPNAVLEGMAMRLPVIGTRVSDVPLLVEGIGFVAEPTDAASLAEAIRSMQALDVAERRRLGEAARRRIESDYDLEVVAQRFWDLHLDLLERARDGRRVGHAAGWRAAPGSRPDV